MTLEMLIAWHQQREGGMLYDDSAPHAHAAEWAVVTEPNGDFCIEAMLLLQTL
jgi:hypothetical protein